MSDAPLMRADNLHKTYRLGRVAVPVLKGTTLNVAAGEWLAILGASGSGKSTLLHLLGALDQPDAEGGEVSYEGRPLSARSRRQRNLYRNQAIGFVFQFYHLLSELNVLENTYLPALVGLPRWRYYGAIGELRRRAAELLKSTGNLDETTGREILGLIAAQHAAGLTIVMVTHDPAIADRADRVARLHNGRIEN
jgi:lipoprotein-releasing system ATP-binding protein